MDFKQISDKHVTPNSKISMLRKRLSQGVVTNSPFRSIPCLSTPPSRVSRILNPFEPYLVERVHLPTFSPNVFVQNSTPKTEEKFKWSIDDISSLNPADIDETTVSQHVWTEDPKTESVVQKKIETFFSESQIVPSPMNFHVNHVPLLKVRDLPRTIHNKTAEETPPKKQTREGATQTWLSLPPILPKKVEEALKPYLEHTEDQQQFDAEPATEMLYQQLFDLKPNNWSPESHNGVESLVSSPPTCLGQMSVQCSPYSRQPGTLFDCSESEDCQLSPISRTPPKTQVPFSGFIQNGEDQMSVDASLNVPDMDKSCFQAGGEASSYNSDLPDTSANWSMEYKHISIVSPSSSTDSNKMDLLTTPHSKLFLGKGQRKRLSESFKGEELDSDDNATQFDDVLMKSRGKICRNELVETDLGYSTYDTGDFSNNAANVFASTPTKRDRSHPDN